MIYVIFAKIMTITLHKYNFTELLKNKLRILLTYTYFELKIW